MVHPALKFLYRYTVVYNRLPTEDTVYGYMLVLCEVEMSKTQSGPMYDFLKLKGGSWSPLASAFALIAVFKSLYMVFNPSERLLFSCMAICALF